VSEANSDFIFVRESNRTLAECDFDPLKWLIVQRLVKDEVVSVIN
jgi:hypothetical protein